MQRRGLIALPTELRRRLHLDEPGAQLEVTERPDGVVEQLENLKADLRLTMGLSGCASLEEVNSEMVASC